MSGKPFRWRTIVEVAVISVVIYIFLGAPGLKTPVQHKPSNNEHDVPTPRAKAESLVYPDTQNLKCAKHEVDMHIFSTQPLVIYIDGFLSDAEVRHLVEIRWPNSTQLILDMTDEDIAKASGKSLLCLTPELSRPTRRFANRIRHSSTETKLFSVSSNEHYRSKAGHKTPSSSVSGLNGTMSLATIRSTTTGVRQPRMR
jgi:hypothetical protein